MLTDFFFIHNRKTRIIEHEAKQCYEFDIKSGLSKMTSNVVKSFVHLNRIFSLIC